MPFVPATNVVQVNFRYTCAGAQVENTLYFRRAGAWTMAQYDDLGNLLTTWWYDNLRPFQGLGCTLRELYMRNLTTATSPVYTHTAGLPDTGLVANELLPNNVTLCVSFRTGNAGRSMRGRNYTVGMVESQQINSSVTIPYRDGMIEAYDALYLSTSVNGYEWVIVSRYANKLIRPAALVTPVQAWTIVDLVTDSQRNRLPNRGT